MDTSNSVRGQEAFDLHSQIVANEKQRRDLMAENGRLLNKMQKEHLYQDFLGDPDSEWAGYLAEVEVWYSRSRVHQMVTCYKRLTEKLGIPEGVWAQVPLSRVMDALSVIDENNYVDWFSKALTLTTRDWNIELREAKKLPVETDDHKHEMVTYDICKKCGRKDKHQHAST